MKRKIDVARRIFFRTIRAYLSLSCCCLFDGYTSFFSGLPSVLIPCEFVYNNHVNNLLLQDISAKYTDYSMEWLFIKS